MQPTKTTCGRREFHGDLQLTQLLLRLKEFIDSFFSAPFAEKQEGKLTI